MKGWKRRTRTIHDPFFDDSGVNQISIGMNRATPRKKQMPRRKAERIVTTGAENTEWKAGDKAHHKKWGVEQS